MTGADAILGFYGKLPAHGDFVRRGVSGELAKALQQWLQTGLAGLSPSEPWVRDERVAGAPVWRFAAAAGVLAAEAVLGVMAPSRDKVGRVYPCIAVAAFDQFDIATAPAAMSWAEAVEAALLRATQQDADADELAEELARIGAPSAAELESASISPLGEGLRVELDAQAGVALALVEAARNRLAPVGEASLWWRLGGRPPVLLWLSGLPVDEVFASLFAADGGEALGSGDDLRLCSS